MKLPLSWLNEYIQIDDIKPPDLAEKLTRAGLQVESIETIGREELSDFFVVVDVLESEAHPNSDHLHVCKVTDGKETYQVVCGAPNMRKGIKTAFAKIGAVVPEGGYKIKKGKLRGVESFGMCCSAKELQLGSDQSGIIEFPAETPVGAFVRDVVPGEKPEVVFDIEVTWNRPDALSVVGLAREFGAILGREVKLPAVDFTESDVPVADFLKVSVEDPVKCPRYTARVMTSVEECASPDWMVKRLELCGMRSLGICVDVTNYVMLELGQPLHAFDSSCLADRTICVRAAREGETIKTLDNVERKLDSSMLVIADAKNPCAVAGVMGGEMSGVSDGTGALVLESALFEPTTVKFTATKLGLGTEASYRYIRGVDRDLADYASRRAVHLLQKHAHAVIAKGLIDVDSRPQPLQGNVELDFTRACRLIGIQISPERMVNILVSLGLKVISQNAECAVFEVPSWRYDLTLEADLVEEIARLYGLDNIPDTMPSAPSISPLSDAPFHAHNRVRELCLALGFTEAMHYSFLSERELNAFDSRHAANRLVIPDPVSVEYGVMRDSLLPQMMDSLGRNATRQVLKASLFEMGKVYSNAGGKPSEEERISLGFYGPVGREDLRTREAVTDEDAALWMKGAVTALINRLHAGHLEFQAAEHPAFVKGATLEIKLNGRVIGILGSLTSAFCHPYRLTTRMVLCEMALKPLLSRVNVLGRVSPVPQFPLVRRDIALVVDARVTHEDIVKTVRRQAGQLIDSITLFDIYKGKSLPKGKRSLAYSLAFRSAERTLTDEEVGQTFDRVVTALKALDGVEVREG